LIALDHGAHGSVQHQDPACQQRLESSQASCTPVAMLACRGADGCGHQGSRNQKTRGQNASG
jgi:hypothetical protein